MIYSLSTTVLSVEEGFKTHHISGSGPDAVFEKESLGWFVHFEGSYEAIYLGDSRPNFNPGDKVKVTFEKVI